MLMSAKGDLRASIMVSTISEFPMTSRSAGELRCILLEINAIAFSI